jgi:hypothetical protein
LQYNQESEWQGHVQKQLLKEMQLQADQKNTEDSWNFQSKNFVVQGMAKIKIVEPSLDGVKMLRRV